MMQLIVRKRLAFKFLVIVIVDWASLVQAKVEFAPYGILKTTALYANKPVSSFSFVNPSAPTSAAYTENMASHLRDQGLWTFQVVQSRAGVDIIQENVFGNLEFDFIDFAVSSPTVEAKPRVRRAFAGYKINEYNRIQIGQDWDSFSPAKPKTLDLVGLYFNSGNTGFMRQQAKWIYKTSDFSGEFSIGLPGKNPTSEFNTVETTASPALAYNANWDGFGIAMYHSSMKFQNQTRSQQTGYSISYTHTFLEKWNIISELYYGQNLNDAGILGISHAVVGRDLKEMGGYLNLTYDSEITGSWTIGYGQAQLLDYRDAGVYTYNTTLKRITEDGILKNQIGRLYWSYKLAGTLSLVTELSYFQTTRNLGSFVAMNESLTAESGFMFNF